MTLKSEKIVYKINVLNLLKGFPNKLCHSTAYFAKHLSACLG